MIGDIAMRNVIAGLLLLAPPALAQQAPLPDAIAAPGQAVVRMFRGTGAQIYECKADSGGKLAWAFREPVATLTDNGKTVGRHFAGPTWELADGSAIVAKAAGNAPGATPADIPWLKLSVVSHHGMGALASVKTVQRLHTQGGTAAGQCDTAGALLSVPYAADYVFLK
jgi:Protein of unknown function (DUF3455)